MTIDIDHLRRWIGRTDEAAETVTPATVQRFNATFNRDSTAVAGAATPLMLHFCLAQPSVATATLGPDGHPARGGFLPPVPLPRRMWAGGAVDFIGDIRIGEVMRRNSVIRDVTLKEGRSGPLCFVTVEHAIFSAARPVLHERQDIVYRGIEAAAAGKPAVPAPEGQVRRSMTPSPPLLFRYSALTFNTHRIHYDAPYAREVEAYPGLVVHGPLQATLLAHLAEEVRGIRPARFSFRSLSPLFDTTDMILNASDEAGTLRLWTASPGGPVAMEARAEW